MFDEATLSDPRQKSTHSYPPTLVPPLGRVGKVYIWGGLGGIYREAGGRVVQGRGSSMELSFLKILG